MAGRERQPAEYKAIEAEKYFQSDEADNVPFEPYTSLILDKLDQRSCRLTDQRKFSLYCATALLDILEEPARLKPADNK